MSTPTNRRTRGEQGIAVIMTALCLHPADDLRRLRRRPGQLVLPRSATSRSPPTPPPSPAPSGCPTSTTATDVACESLAKNGIVGSASSPDCAAAAASSSPSTRGSTATSLRVTVDRPQRHAATSRRCSAATQSLSRARRGRVQPARSRSAARSTTSAATAARSTQPTRTYQYAIDWPADYTTSACRPTRRCNVGDDGAGRTAGRTAGQRHDGWPTRRPPASTPATPGARGRRGRVHREHLHRAPPTTTAPARPTQHPLQRVQRRRHQRPLEQRHDVDTRPRPPGTSTRHTAVHWATGHRGRRPARPDRSVTPVNRHRRRLQPSLPGRLRADGWWRRRTGARVADAPSTATRAARQPAVPLDIAETTQTHPVPAPAATRSPTTAARGSGR